MTAPAPKSREEWEALTKDAFAIRVGAVSGKKLALLLDSIMALQSEVERAKTATPPGTEVVPEGTSDTLHRVFSDLMGIELIDGEMIAAGVEPPTIKEITEYVAKSLDAITRHRATKEPPNAQG